MNVPMIRGLGLGVVTLAALLAAPAAAQFDQFEWTFSGSGTGSGSVTNDTMIIAGPDGGFCTGATNSFTAVAPYDLLVMATFDVDNWDKGGHDYDYLVTLVDGKETFVSGACFDCQLVVEVPAGSTFGFGVHSLDCVFGAATATLTNLLVQPAPQKLVATGIEPGSQFGAALTALDDLDGDGVPEVAVGAPLGAGKGRVTIHKGSDLAVVRVLVGPGVGDNFGSALAAVGDLNGDGHGDLLVGAPLNNGGGPDSGAAFLHSGFTGLLLDTFAGSTAGDHFGSAVGSAGDVDGDGADDLLVGAPAHDGTGTDAGLAVLLSGATGLPLHTWTGAAGDNLGHALAGVGDVDGDGVPDVAIGSPRANLLANDSGTAQLFSGATGLPIHTLLPLACGTFDGDLFGSALAGLGDVDEDGVPDVAAGAPNDSCGNLFQGSAWFFSGADGHVLSSLLGTDTAHHLGAALAGVGDVNADGRLDVLVGSPTNNLSPPQPGRVQVVTAIDGSLLFALVGSLEADSFGRAVASAGDTDGDGHPDLLVGVPATDTVETGTVLSLQPSFLWADLGHALAGTLGPPSLQAQGLLAEGTPLALTLADTAPGLPVTLVVGLAELSAPFKGGVLVPTPDLLVGLVSATPEVSLAGPMPPGIPSGTELHMQMWIVDAAGPKGLAASNAMRGTVP